MVVEYFQNLFKNVSQFGGAVFGRTLNSKEGLSGSSWRTRNTPVGAFLYKWINKVWFWEEDHCKISAEKDIQNCRELLEAYNTK